MAAAPAPPARIGDSWKRVGILLLALAGIGVAGYLSYARLSGAAVQCLGIGGCEEVSASRWGEIVLPIGGPAGLHVPIALLGLGMYVAVVVLALVPGGRLRLLADQATFLLAFAGVLYSAYLTYIELFVLRKICPWCVASAVIVTLICILALTVPLRGQAEEDAD